MKCKSCGYELSGNERFCGNCGEPVQQAAEQNKKKYINIGHPIGYTKINNQIVYLVDNGMQQVQLPQEVFAEWAKMPQETPNEDDIVILEKTDCTLNVKDTAQSRRFMNCIPCRQGFGAAHEGKHAVVLGHTPVLITENQMIVWRLADGKNTLTRIGVMAGMEEWDVMDAVWELVGYDLVYLKFAR